MSSLFQPVRPRGESIRDYVSTPLWGRCSREIRFAARSLDRTVKDGVLRKVRTGVQKTAYLEATGGRPSADYDPVSRQIHVSPDSKRPATDWLHEVGHVLYLDRVLPAREVVGASLLQGFQNACEDSATTKYLRGIAEAMTSQPEVVRLIQYALEPEEQFVRSFAQFVAVRSSEGPLRREVHEWSLDGKRDVPVFWGEQDFVRIDSELVTLFRRLGWIRI